MNRAEIDVLLIEDDELEIELALSALRREAPEVQIQVVRDGEEALEFLADQEVHLADGTSSFPKLILLDQKLPKVDGTELLRQIKSNPVTQLIPVVVLTSSSRNEDLVSSYRLGANSYIQKPVNFNHFKDMMTQVVAYWVHVNQLPAPSALRLEKSDFIADPS